MPNQPSLARTATNHEEARLESPITRGEAVRAVTWDRTRDRGISNSLSLVCLALSLYLDPVSSLPGASLEKKTLTPHRLIAGLGGSRRYVPHSYVTRRKNVFVEIRDSRFHTLCVVRKMSVFSSNDETTRGALLAPRSYRLVRLSMIRRFETAPKRRTAVG